MKFEDISYYTPNREDQLSYVVAVVKVYGGAGGTHLAGFSTLSSGHYQHIIGKCIHTHLVTQMHVPAKRNTQRNTHMQCTPCFFCVRTASTHKLFMHVEREIKSMFT